MKKSVSVFTMLALLLTVFAMPAMAQEDATAEFIVRDATITINEALYDLGAIEARLAMQGTENVQLAEFALTTEEGEILFPARAWVSEGEISAMFDGMTKIVGLGSYERPSSIDESILAERDAVNQELSEMFSLTDREDTQVEYDGKIFDVQKRAKKFDEDDAFEVLNFLLEKDGEYARNVVKFLMVDAKAEEGDFTKEEIRERVHRLWGEITIGITEYSNEAEDLKVTVAELYFMESIEPTTVTVIEHGDILKIEAYTQPALLMTIDVEREADAEGLYKSVEMNYYIHFNYMEEVRISRDNTIPVQLLQDIDTVSRMSPFMAMYYESFEGVTDSNGEREVAYSYEMGDEELLFDISGTQRHTDEETLGMYAITASTDIGIGALEVSANVEIRTGQDVADIAAPQGESVNVFNGNTEEIEALVEEAESIIKQDVAKFLEHEQIAKLTEALTEMNQRPLMSLDISDKIEQESRQTEEPKQGSGLRAAEPKPTR